MMLEEGRQAVESAGISMLLVDQMEPAGGTIADCLKLPFVTICNALALNRDGILPCLLRGGFAIPGLAAPETEWVI